MKNPRRTGRGRTIVSLALLCTDLDSPDAAQRARAALHHRVLDWAVDEGWTVEQWGLRHSSHRTALEGQFKARGPRLPLLNRLPVPVLYLLAWVTHLVLLVGARKRDAPVVCHTPLLGLGAAFARLLRINRQPFVIRVVGRTATSAEHLQGNRRKAAAIDRAESFVVRRADLVLAVSEFTAGLATQAGVPRDRIVLLPAHVSTAASAPPARKPADPLRVVCGARLIPEKGVDTLVRAFGLLRQEDGAMLEIAGDGPERIRIERLVQRLGLNDRVVLHGWVEPAEMVSMLDQAHVAALASRCEEGLPRFLVEAGRSGCALVGTALGGTGDIVRAGETGFLVPADDPARLAAALKQLLREGDTREQFGQAARERAHVLDELRHQGLARFRSFCSRDQALRIVHLIPTLDVGGAEILLRDILRRAVADGAEPRVVTLGPPGLLAPEVNALGVPVHSLNVTVRSFPLAFLSLARWLRRQRPDVVQTWMYHADFIGGLAARLAGVRVIWSIHGTDPSSQGRRVRVLIRANALLSRWTPDRIICTSETAQQDHVAVGYAAHKMVVIHNGVEILPVAVDEGHGVRRELGGDATTPLVGRVGRFHPQKDYRTFIEAARLVNQRHPDAQFVLCGKDVTWDNGELASWVERVGLADRCHLLGLRRDVPAIYAACDLAVSSSAFGETTPLAVAEAMVQATPVVVTDVGDSALLVGDTGRVVPPGESRQLAAAIADMLDLSEQERKKLGEAGRLRIAQHFTIDRTAAAYAELHKEVAGRP